MIHKVVCILITIFPLYSNSQPIKFPGKPRMFTEEENKADIENHGCVETSRFTSKQRLKNYPFKNATEIKLISFDLPDSLYAGGELPLTNGFIDNNKVIEDIKLSPFQIDSLTQILYNINYKGFFYTIYESQCYSPRNAIIFNNLKGKTIAFIELCFECHNHRLSSKKVKSGDFCDEKYEQLRTYFRQCGILFGTQEKVYE